MNAPAEFALRPALAQAARQPLLALRAAGVSFGDKQALQGVDLTLHAGERLALIGANGSGKTTLLRLLHGLLPPSHGQRDVHALPGRHGAPRMAMLFQRPFLLNLSVRRNLLLGLWLAGVPKAERADRAADALRRVGLHAEGQRTAGTLSGGQQQRLALARAWALHPDVLFLDEPTASLDPGAKREVESLMEEFGSEGLTLVLSTHNLGQAKRLATHVAYLETGRLRALAPVDDFFGAATPPAASAFLKGENPWL